MTEPGIRNSRVADFALTRSRYERLQPQGGRGICPLGQDGGRGGQYVREGIRGADQLFEQRSCARSAPELNQSSADCRRETHSARQLHGFTTQIGAHHVTLAALLFVCTLAWAGCAHKQTKLSFPPPPGVDQPDTTAENSESATAQPAHPEETASPNHEKPLLVETGLASWYGAPYHNRRSSNGEIYDMHAMTAAHRTLPMGSTVRVTNVKTGHSAIVRITDRGPFIHGRILDLSEAAAKKVDIWSAGVATVRMEVLRTPLPINSAGRWAVQIGAFERQDSADKLADHLTRRYQTAKIHCFSSPVGDWWVRVRVKDDDRQRAEMVAHETHTPEGDIFLVRLD